MSTTLITNNSPNSFLFQHFLPVELARIIFSYFTPEQLSRICAVNTTWNKFASHDNLWLAFFPIKKEYFHWIPEGTVKMFMILHRIKDSVDMHTKTLTLNKLHPGRLISLYHLMKGYLKQNGTVDEKKECNTLSIRGRFGTKAFLPVAYCPAEQHHLSELAYFDLKGTLKDTDISANVVLSIVCAFA